MKNNKHKFTVDRFISKLFIPLRIELLVLLKDRGMNKLSIKRSFDTAVAPVG
jgi:hypothetical protein